MYANCYYCSLDCLYTDLLLLQLPSLFSWGSGTVSTIIYTCTEPISLVIVSNENGMVLYQHSILISNSTPV